MNQFLNPIFLANIIKSYLFDINRIWTSNENEIRKYQNSAFKKMVKYAYTVPIYHNKYKKAGIHPNDIKNINDIKKLPFITKSDLMEYSLGGIIPINFNMEKNYLISTSGSTGKPVCVYIDIFSAVKSLLGFVRILKTYGGVWRKSKITLIIDLEKGTEEYIIFYESTLPFLKRFFSLDNIRYLHIDENPETLIKKIHEFKPEFLGSDPATLRKLAVLKNNGFGKEINPSYIVSSASMLDDYTKKYVENAFETRVLDVYGATETGPIAFECINGNHYQVHSDFVFLEFLNENEEPVEPGNLGAVVATKLYGKGTPIIRYTGLDDLAIPLEDRCNHKIKTQMITNIEGRKNDLIILPNRNTITPLSITTIIRKVMDDFNIFKIKQFQIIQHKLDEIEVLIVIDDKLKNSNPSFDSLQGEIIKKFSEKIGNNVKIFVNEVEDIKRNSWTELEKVVVSKLSYK